MLAPSIKQIQTFCTSTGHLSIPLSLFSLTNVRMEDKRIPHRLLFNGKYVMVEEPVKFLIGVVNTELLKAVCLKENVRQISKQWAPPFKFNQLCFRFKTNL